MSRARLFLNSTVMSAFLPLDVSAGILDLPGYKRKYILALKLQKGFKRKKEKALKFLVLSRAVLQMFQTML